MSTQSLQAAMACLDLSLEAELTLYRRHHAQSLVPSTEMPESAEDEAVSLDNLAQQDVAETAPQSAGELLAHEPSLAFSAADADIVQGEMPVNPSRALVPVGQTLSEDAETLPEPYGAEMTAEPKAFERFLDPSIEDYLESSEALLKHLEDSAASTDQQVKQLTRKFWVATLRNLAIALGGLGAIGLVVAMMVQWLAPKPRKADPVPQPSVQTQLSPNTNQPNLAGAANANPLTDVSRVGTVAVVPTPLSPRPSLASPSPIVDSKAAYYAVVADYTNSESLQKARQLVPDAFITTFEGQKRIQLAWLNELQAAQKLVEDLKNEGFAASIVAQN